MNNTLNDSIIDLRDVIARFEELEDLEERDSDENEEFESIKKLLEELAGYGGDEQWRGDWYPCTLISDDAFADYAQELLKDCGTIPSDLPEWVSIDWDETAKAVQQDYSSVELDGDTYWYR